MQIEKTVPTWASRLLTFGLLCISLLLAFGAHPVFAHNDHPATSTSDQVNQGLLLDEDLCGIDGYRLPGTDLCTHGQDLPPTLEQVEAVQASLAHMSTSPMACNGDGISGKRVQVMYVRTVDQADRYAEVVEKLRAIAAGVDAIYEASAQETDGHRHIQFVTNASCEIDVLAVTLPTDATRDFVKITAALDAQGYNSPDRKYLLFVDDNVYCGIATAKRDSQPGLANANNQKVGYARIDRMCWGAMTAAHELTHTLGGVQNDAPHTTNGWHCTDEHDIMCYSDADNAPAMTIVCNDESHEYRLDCNHDDYFHTNPPLGTYLSTHWNVANSEYLSTLPTPTLPLAELPTDEIQGQSVAASAITIYLPMVLK
ncbi:hypothetical protein BH10CHL1_BH10CHL1_03950 [soil metagenome]